MFRLLESASLVVVLVGISIKKISYYQGRVQTEETYLGGMLINLAKVVSFN